MGKEQIAILNRKIRGPTEETFEEKLEGVRKRAIQISRGRAFEAGRIASAKALGWEVCLEMRSVRLGQREAGRREQ